MQLQTLSLSLMHFDGDELMPVDADAGTRTVVGVAPIEVDLMLSLVSEPEAIRLEDFRTRESDRLAG